MKETKLPVFNEENQVSCLINEGAIVVAENTTLEVVSHNSCLDQRLSTTSSKEEEIDGESRLLVSGRASLPSNLPAHCFSDDKVPTRLYTLISILEPIFRKAKKLTLKLSTV